MRTLLAERAEIRQWEFAGDRGRLPLHCKLLLRDHSLRTYDVYVWSISHGGRTRRRSEYRIQTKLPDGSADLQFGRGVTLLLGYYTAQADLSDARADQLVPDEMEVFVAWDAVAHLKVGLSSSCQVDFSLMYDAYLSGFSSSSRRLLNGSSEKVIAFRPERLAQYLTAAWRGHEHASLAAGGR